MTNYKKILGYKLLQDIDENYYDVVEAFLNEYDLIELVSRLLDYEIDLTNLSFENLQFWLYRYGRLEGKEDTMISFASALTYGSRLHMTRLGQLIYELDHAKDDVQYLKLVTSVGRSLKVLSEISKKDMKL